MTKESVRKMQKNILIIVSDHLTWRAITPYGNTFVKTPNMDRIAENSVIFENCYTPCPLCQPARTSLWTSKHCHETGALINDKYEVQPKIPDTMSTLGQTFKEAGYETVHFGKTHDTGALRGFDCAPVIAKETPDEHEAFPLRVDSYNDFNTVTQCVDYLENKSKDKPFLMIADMFNPHDICQYIGVNMFEHKKIPLPEGYELPPLPENFAFDDILNRAKPVQYICCSHSRQAQVSSWKDEDDFRHYLAAFYYYVSLVDRHIGEVLDALEKSGHKDDTLVVLTADHGDGMVARKKATKQVDMYEETTHIPFIFGGGGEKTPTRLNDYVSSLDLFPTLCGYAGIEVPENLSGIDLSNALQGKATPHREYVVSQWHSEWNVTISPGRMIAADGIKYIRYIEDDFEELYDLISDPYEKTNVAKDPRYAPALEKMRGYFKHYLETSNDPFLSLEVVVPEESRHHAVGYENHVGYAEPMKKDVALNRANWLKK